MDVWEELLPDEDGTGISPLLKSQYDVLYGRWPESYDEVVLVVGETMRSPIWSCTRWASRLSRK